LWKKSGPKSEGRPISYKFTKTTIETQSNSISQKSRYLSSERGFPKPSKRNKNEVITDLSSISDDRESDTNSIQNDENDLQTKLLKIVQTNLADIYSNDETKEDLLMLPQKLLI